jgi:hypothetical protein
MAHFNFNGFYIKFAKTKLICQIKKLLNYWATRLTDY